MPDPKDQFDFEQSKLPDDMSLEPVPDMEPLGEAGPTDDTASAEETLSPDAVPPAKATEEAAGPESVEEEGKKRKKKAKKKEKIKKIKDTSKDSAEEEKGDLERKNKFSDFLQQITEASPYTVMLGVAVVFLLIAVLCLLIELNRYHFDVNAKEAKERTAMRLSLDKAGIDLLQG